MYQGAGTALYFTVLVENWEGISYICDSESLYTVLFFLYTESATSDVLYYTTQYFYYLLLDGSLASRAM